MDQFCDLHTHSTFSDGTLTPTELIEAAETMGLGAIALCDHNNVGGLPEFIEAARGRAVEAVPGVEFSVEYLGKELHILGLYIQPEHFATVTALLEGLLARKEQSNIDLCRKLREEGLAVDYEKIKAGTPGGVVNRALIGAEMAHLGYCGSVKEAFDRWLSVDRGYFHPPKRPDAFEMIAFIKSIGAVAVLAHPFLNLTEEELRLFLPQAAAAGLDGMEVLYPKFDAQTTALAGALAKTFGLLPSGGSDFHGANKPDIQLGRGKGELFVPMDLLEALRERIKSNTAKEI